MKQTTDIDPATGETATLSQLAWRYQIKVGTLHWRYQQGLRGHDLVAPLNEPRGEAIRQGIAARRYASRPGREELIQAALTSPLTRPFNQIALERTANG